MGYNSFADNIGLSSFVQLLLAYTIRYDTIEEINVDSKAEYKA